MTLQSSLEHCIPSMHKQKMFLMGLFFNRLMLLVKKQNFQFCFGYRYVLPMNIL